MEVDIELRSQLKLNRQQNYSLNKVSEISGLDLIGDKKSCIAISHSQKDGNKCF